MPKFYLIMEGNFPSMCHARYTDKAEADKEADRLEKIRQERNKRIDEQPATGRGSCFMNVKDTEPWSVAEREFPR